MNIARRLHSLRCRQQQLTNYTRDLRGCAHLACFIWYQVLAYTRYIVEWVTFCSYSHIGRFIMYPSEPRCQNVVFRCSDIIAAAPGHQTLGWNRARTAT